MAKKLTAKQTRRLLKSFGDSNVVDPKLALKERLKDEITKEIVDQVEMHLDNAVEDIMYGLMLTLRDEFNFGAKRIERVLEGIATRAGDIRSGLITRDDVHNVLKEEVKFDFHEFAQNWAKK